MFNLITRKAQSYFLGHYYDKVFHRSDDRIRRLRKLLSDERKFELALKKLEQCGQELINMNKVYLSRNPESNFEFIYKINEQLLILADKIAQLYHESRK